VYRSDDCGVAGPDNASGRDRDLLRVGEQLRRTLEVRDVGKSDPPLQHSTKALLAASARPVASIVKYACLYTAIAKGS